MARVTAEILEPRRRPTQERSHKKFDHLLRVSRELLLDVGFESYFATVAGTFADVRNGDILLYEDSYWNVALAINGGNAAETLAVRPGADLRVRRAT